jgi:hypothetical protein
MLQMMARTMSRLPILVAAVITLASGGAGSAIAQSAIAQSALAQNAHEPFLRRDVPPTAWHFDGRDDIRDFQNNGFFPGDFAARPGSAWLGAAGLFGFTPSGGSQFSVIYCTRRYRSHNRLPGYFQGDDGVWYRCHR